MDNDEHLSQIETLWSVVIQAHVSKTERGQRAKQRLLERYGSAIRRYLTAVLRDLSAAEDVYQDFALRFVRGDFRSADPDKGRFRSFLKTILFRMVIDHHRKQKRDQAAPLDEQYHPPSIPTDEAQRDQQFTDVWRDEILKRAWQSLAEAQQESGTPWYTVMRFRIQYPDLRSDKLAAAISEELGRSVSASNVRVLLHRARSRFSDCLIDVIADSLSSNSIDEIEEELADLKLLEYCQEALAARRAEK